MARSYTLPYSCFLPLIARTAESLVIRGKLQPLVQQDINKPLISVSMLSVILDVISLPPSFKCYVHHPSFPLSFLVGVHTTVALVSHPEKCQAAAGQFKTATTNFSLQGGKGGGYASEHKSPLIHCCKHWLCRPGEMLP